MVTEQTRLTLLCAAALSVLTLPHAVAVASPPVAIAPLSASIGASPAPIAVPVGQLDITPPSLAHAVALPIVDLPPEILPPAQPGSTLTFTTPADSPACGVPASGQSALLDASVDICPTLDSPLECIVDSSFCPSAEPLDETGDLGYARALPDPRDADESGSDGSSSSLTALSPPLAGSLLRVGPPVAPADIVISNFTIDPADKKVYSKGIYIFVPSGNSIELWEVDASGNPTDKAVTASPRVAGATTSRYVPYRPFFNVGAAPLKAKSVLPPGVVRPRERYRLASLAALTETKRFLVKSGSSSKYIIVGLGVLGEIARPVAPPVPPPGALETVPVPARYTAPKGADYKNSKTLADVVTRAKEFQNSDPGTRAHETVHGINAWIVNTYASLKAEYAYTKNCVTAYPAAGMYFGNGTGVLVRGIPGVTFSSILRLVPPKLRASRVEVYFRRPERENAGKATPIYDVTYLLDEANAYVLDAETALELYTTHYTAQRFSTGVTEGAGEFISYSLALLYYAQTNDVYKGLDKKYMARLVGATKLNIERAAKAYKAGLDVGKYPKFNVGRRDFLQLLATDPDPKSKALRSFAVKMFGQVWFDGIVK